MSKWYGSLQNRLEENHDSVPEITVGTGMTEYSWSDREAYEVVAVRDQKHVTVRRMKHKHIGGEPYTNDWELTSDPDGPEYDMVKRGKYWYYTTTWTRDEYESLDAERQLRALVAGVNPDKLRARGKQTMLRRANVSFGRAEYYYDYSF